MIGAVELRISYQSKKKQIASARVVEDRLI
jgi:hypothetical protein